MAQSFLTVGWVSDRILWVLKNALEVADFFNTEWESEFGKAFPVGSSFQIKMPQEWLINTGLGYNPQGISRISTTVNLDQVFNIHFEWDSYERLVKMERGEDELMKNYLIPAGIQLAQEADSRAAQWAAQNSSNMVGVLGTDQTAYDVYGQAEAVLFAKACPKGDKNLCLSASQAYNYIKTNVVSQFNPQSDVSKMFRQGVLGDMAGFRVVRSNSLYKMTAGTAAAHSTTVTGANQSGSSLIITGTNADTIKAGDKFVIANVNAVNPKTRKVIAATQGATTGTLQVFTALADYTLDGSADTISIAPAIYGPGSPYQNVDALPANSAALTFWPGTSSPSGKSGSISLALSRYAFALASGKFEVPKAVERSESSEDPDTGLNIRFVRAWDQRESKMTNRYDCCIGFGNLRADQGAVAIAGA